LVRHVTKPYIDQLLQEVGTFLLEQASQVEEVSAGDSDASASIPSPVPSDEQADGSSDIPELSHPVVSDGVQASFLGEFMSDKEVQTEVLAQPPDMQQDRCCNKRHRLLS
jgi:hypothetical protein